MPRPDSNRNKRIQQREATRASILDAALIEFSEKGYEGASTREIARRAGVHPALIKYHFDGKESLWRSAVNFLFERQELELKFPRMPLDTPAARKAYAAEAIRQIVYYFARHPEHARLMVQESCSDTERFRWAADTHMNRMSHAAGAFIEHMQREGVFAPGSVTALVYILVGGATLFYMLAPEVRRVWQTDPQDPAAIEAHAEALVRLFVR
jgi:AcrR family transcriptional regulator